MNCKECPQEGSIKYLHIKNNTKYVQAAKDYILTLNKKIKDNTQCQASATYSIDEMEVMLQVCVPDNMTISSVKNFTPSYFQVLTAKEASNEIGMNPEKWDPEYEGKG
jgi:hypothetical protein